MKNTNAKPRQFGGQTVKRLLRYVTGTFKVKFALVMVFILISAAAGVAGSLFLQILVDNYITPLLSVANPNFSGLLAAILIMGVIYLTGVICNYLFNHLMLVIGQGVQKRIRDDMFAGMQKLPIRYFDTHSYGDIMSHYTNDIDTLRQMISQSIPQMLSAVVTMVFALRPYLFSASLSHWLSS